MSDPKRPPGVSSPPPREMKSKSLLPDLRSRLLDSIGDAVPRFDFTGRALRSASLWTERSHLFSDLISSSDSVASIGALIYGPNIEPLRNVKQIVGSLAGSVTTKQLMSDRLVESVTSASLAGAANSAELLNPMAGFTSVWERISGLHSSDALNIRAASAVSVVNEQLSELVRFRPPSIVLFPSIDWIAELTRNIALSRAHLPSNWRDVAFDPDEVEEDVRELLEEGFPLAWVPTGRVIELLLEASDAPARRRVISRNYRGILTDCERVLGQLPLPKALVYADMTRKAIRALRDGHVEAGQSLATNVFDTLVTQHAKAALGLSLGALKNPSSYLAVRKKGWRIALAVLPVSTIMRGDFDVDDRPPGYRRNATAHAITRHQYNRINAVIAIMNATALLSCFVRDTPAFDS